MKGFIIGVVSQVIISSWIMLAIGGIISIKTAILVPVGIFLGLVLVGIVLGLVLAMWLFCSWLDSKKGVKHD